MKRIRTTCPYCGCGCGMVLSVEDGRLLNVSPDPASPVGRGKLCVKGWSGHGFLASRDRLRKPLIRRGGEGLVESTWDEALDLIADRLSATIKEHGPDSVAVLSSARATNEENYLLQKFARATLRTNNVDHCARLCHASTVSGLAMAFGSGAMTNSIDDLSGAGCFFVIGSNTTEQHPFIGGEVIEAVTRGGASLIVADPRRIELSEFADVVMQQRPGTDVALLNGMMHVILTEGLEDRDFIELRTEGFSELRETVMKYPPEVASEICGVPAEDIVRAARLFAGAKRAAILYAMGITQHTTGTDNVLSIANLAMLTGNVGQSGSGVNPLRGQNNVQGACDMGALPNVYPGYQSVTNAEVREKFAAAWGVDLNPVAGLPIPKMFDAALEKKVRAMFVMGENPMISDANLNHVEEALKSLDFLVVQDLFLTETAALADVVLPAAAYAEKDGTFTNTERRVQLVRKALDPPGEARADWEIIQDLSTRMGYPMSYASPAEILAEVASLTPSYGGITAERLEDGGLQWPCPSADHPGTPILHTAAFARGKGKFTAVDYRPPAEEADDEYPFTLTTGRILFQYHTGTMSRRSPHLEREYPRGFVEINPEDAKELKVRDGQEVVVSSRRGEVKTAALVTPRVPRKVVFMPFHYAEAAANLLTNNAIDPVASIPELKVAAVRIKGA